MMQVNPPSAGDSHVVVHHCGHEYPKHDEQQGNAFVSISTQTRVILRHGHAVECVGYCERCGAQIRVEVKGYPLWGNLDLELRKRAS